MAISKNRAKYFNDYCNLHFKKFGYSPSFGIIFKNRELVVSSPKAIWGKPSSFYRIPLSILLEETEFSYIYIHYEIMTKASNNLCTRQYFKIDISELGSLPIYFPNQPGSYMMTITFYHAAISKDLTLPLNVTKPWIPILNNKRLIKVIETCWRGFRVPKVWQHNILLCSFQN